MDHNINCMFDELAKIPYHIRFDAKKVKHDLIGLIMDDAEYI